MNRLKKFTKEYIEAIPKTINNNGCWIPLKLKPGTNGYVRININGKRYLLHRLVLSIYYSIGYYDDKIETRHSKGCDRACFNHEHIKPGSQIENKKDKVEHTLGDKCPKCGDDYVYRRTIKGGIPRVERRCKTCHIRNQKLRRAKLREKSKLD